MHRKRFQKLKEDLGVQTARRVRLSEDARTGKPHRVDREAGIIYGCKLIGLSSPNSVPGMPQIRGRRYLLEALRAAIPLYEGSQVNRDHLTEDEESRSSLEAVGEVRNVRAGEDGLYGDLHLIQPYDTFTSKLLWAAENMPNAFGLSPHHHVDGQAQGDVFVIDRVLSVESVDVVRRAATTAGLFEAHMTDTEKKDLEAKEMEHGMDDPLALEKKPEEMMEQPEELPVEGTGDWRAMLGRVAGELMATEDAEAHDVAKKIMAILKPASAEIEPVITEAEEDGEEEEKPEEDAKEGKQRQASATGYLALENMALRLCLQNGIKPSDIFLESLVKVGDEKKMLALIEERGKAPAKPAPTLKPQKPQSAPTRVTEAKTTPSFRLPTAEEYERAILN